MSPSSTEHRLEILVEEKSMEIFLWSILPIILPDPYRLDGNCFIRTHEGKQHLKKSIKGKVRAYPNFPSSVKLIIIQDQDSNDCKRLKNDLTDLVRRHNQPIPLLIRIACRELENWYLGDLSAVQSLYPKSNAIRHKNKARYRNSDNIPGANEIKRLVGRDFTKTNCATNIGQYMDLHKNNSVSFQNFLNGFKTFCQ